MFPTISVSDSEAQYSGIAITSSGTFDASLAAALDLSDSDEDEEERREEPCANDVDGDKRRYGELSPNPDANTTFRPQGVTEEVPQRSAGRPPKPTPTTPPMTSPDGAVLFRDPGRAVADAREKACNPVSPVSAIDSEAKILQLVNELRDSRPSLKRNAQRPRSVSKTAWKADYRVKEAHGSDTNDMTRLLIFYRAESDRKAETAELRRHEEKAQRDAVKWKAEKEENRRQFEARMELERSEARERHSEMMMTLAKLINK
ncbi:hypothetical protein GN244_ATG12520 [Phytophthora infestans]|uniref:Uncharacterized protein n=1 Tax=Phytophthora infestans TaxID=4787 RepID=A0A833SL77_PHYIN|nr:hypothetical protein GN244_ATG12520 [Phytophthora infestans]